VSADTVLIHGNIVTMNPSQPTAQAVALKEGLIVEVGTNNKVQKWIDERTRIVDLNGKTVVPGLIDTHVHMADFGFSLFRIDLRGVESIKEIQRLLQMRVQETPKEMWIIGRGWDQERLKEKRYPTRWDLDKVTPNNPVILTRVCGHIGVANSRALEIAGISKETTMSIKGQIDTDPKTGEITGIVREAAHDLVWKALPEPSEKELSKACTLACEKAVDAGLTSVHWLVDNPMEISILQRLRQQGKLLLRVYLIIPIESLNTYADAGLSTSFSDHALRLGGVKILADGSLGARTAALNKPYNDEPSTMGILCYSEKQLHEMIVKAEKTGFQVCIHAIGDRALSTVLKAFEKAYKDLPKKMRRHRIEHASVLNRQLVKRLRKLSLIVCIQPHFVVSDFWVESRLGPERAKWTHPFKTLIKNGILLAGGSDCPVEPINPLLGVYALVAREFLPSERVSVEEALRIYTVNAAYVSFEENVKGSIETGKFADLTVLSHNPLTIKPEKIKDIKVEMTFVGGKMVYSRSRA